MKIIKTVMFGLILLAGVATSMADGLINFFTFNANPAYGRVFFFPLQPDQRGTIPVSGPQFMGQLVVGPTVGSLTPIGTPTPFLSGSGAGYINFGNVTVTGVEAGTTYLYALRAWDGPNYNTPFTFQYQTSTVQIVLGGTTAAGGFFGTPQANGFLSNQIPEPTTLALAGLGLATLFMAQRHKRD